MAAPVPALALRFLGARGTHLGTSVSRNPYAAPQTPSVELGLPQPHDAEQWVRTYRWFALVVVVVAAFTEGFLEQSSSPARVLVAIALASALTLWCGLDGRVHGKILLRASAWALMFTWPIGVAVHLVWTRGARGIVTYVLGVLVCLAAALVGMLVGGLVLPG